MAHMDPALLIDGLRASGLRVTKARAAVCDVLAESHDEHLSAAELHERAERVAGQAIDPSTIYRIIDALESAGHLHHVHLGHGPGVVHLSGSSDHHHLLCEVCGRTVDVPVGEMSDLTRGVEERYGFIADSIHFALVGRCADHQAE